MICPKCLGSGWRLYFVETVEGEEERAWELCSECREGDAFPSKEGGQASASSSLRSSQAIASPVARTSHAHSNGGEGSAAESCEALNRMRVTRPLNACRGSNGSYRPGSLEDTRNSPKCCNKEV